MKEDFTFVIVCHCTGATDRQIRALVRNGAKSPRAALSRACQAGPAGMGCGGCRHEIERIVRDESQPSETLLADVASVTA